MSRRKTDISAQVTFRVSDISITGLRDAAITANIVTKLGALPLASGPRSIRVTAEISQIIDILEGLILTQVLDSHNIQEK